MSQPKLYALSATPFLTIKVREVFNSANAALEKAYAPYSHYRVGAAILASNGKIYQGCNVETANYDGTHAEEAALAAMVVDGQRSPMLCVCVGALEDATVSRLAPPCGKCRQALTEFSSLTGETLWVMVGDIMHGMHYMKLSELLPNHFGPADIGIDLAKYQR